MRRVFKKTNIAERLDLKSSVECKKVVSAFLSFCGKKQFCAQISFVFYCFLTSCFVHKNVNSLS